MYYVVLYKCLEFPSYKMGMRHLKGQSYVNNDKCCYCHSSVFIPFVLLTDMYARYVLYRVRNFKRRICQKGLQVKFGTYRSPEKKSVAALPK